MRVIKETPDNLTVRELPVLGWLCAAAFVPLGLLVLHVSFSASSTPTFSHVVGGLVLALGLLCALVSLGGVRTWRVEKRDPQLQVWRGLVFKSQSRRVPVGNIVSVNLRQAVEPVWVESDESGCETKAMVYWVEIVSRDGAAFAFPRDTERANEEQMLTRVRAALGR